MGDFFEADGEFEGLFEAEGGKCFAVEIGDDVAEVVDFEDGSGPGAFAGAGDVAEGEAEGVGDLFAELGGGESFGEVGGDGGKNIAAVECFGDGFAEVAGVGEFADGALFAGHDHAEDAVIGADEGVAATLDDDGAAEAADTGIDDGDVDGLLGEPFVVLGHDEGSLGDFIGLDAVRDIDDFGVGGDGENDAFHDAGEVVFQSKVGGERNDRPGHACYDEKTGSTAAVNPMERCYFDHNATTPLREEAMAALCAALRDVHGNASSIHHYGQEAKQKLEAARRQVAALLGANAKEIVFTSGGTEGNNLALFGVTKPGDHVVTTAIEHPAVLNPCARLRECGVEVTVVAPGADGVVTPEAVARAMRANTRLVSVMHANNETGTLQPVVAIAEVAHRGGALMHVDGVQAVGKFPVNLFESKFDLYTVSGHKLNAPKGIGALYVRKGLTLRAQMLGGHHERDRRAGTENVPGAVAFGAAAHWWLHHGRDEAVRLAGLRDRLEARVLSSISDVRVNGSTTHRLGTTTNLRLDGIEGEAVVIAMDLRGYAISSGSACSSGAVEPSHVLLAMGLTKEQARSSIRISLGLGNTEEQVDGLAAALADAVKHLRRIAPAYSHA